MKKAFFLLALFCVTLAFADDSDITLSVTASAPETTQAIESITKEQIDETQATDLIDVLQKGMGLSVNRNGAYGNTASVNMRGFGSGRIAFLINGVPVNSSQNGGFDIFSIDVNSIERIEVIQGGSDSKYNVSGAMGGVINIITVKNRPEGLSLKGTIENTGYMPGTYLARHTYAVTPLSPLSLLDTQKATLNLGYGFDNSSLAIDIFGVKATNEFIFLDDYGYRLRTGNEVLDAGINASYTKNLRDNSSIIFSGNVYAGDKNIPTGMSSSTINKQQDFNFRESILLDLKAVTDVLDTEAFISHASDNQTFESSEHKVNTVTLTNRWTWYTFDNLFMKFSGDYTFHHLNSTDIGNVHRHSGGVSANAEYYPIDNFTIIPSVKLLLQENHIVPLPKIGFLFTPIHELRIKHNWFRGFKFPNFNDLYWKGDGGVGNPDLKPEDGIGTDIIIEYSKKNILFANASLYATYQQNSIHWRPLPGSTTWTPQNVGEAFLWGSDIQLTSDFTSLFTLSLNYSLLMSYILTGDYTFESEVRMPYMPMHRIGLSVKVPWSSGNIVISGNYEGERHNTSYMLDEDLDAYFLLDARVNQNIGEHVTVYGSINNILNEDYVMVEGYPMPKLHVKIGVSYEM